MKSDWWWVTGALEKRKQVGRWHVRGLGTGSLVALHVVREGKKAIIGRIIRRSIPGRENGNSKGPEAGWYLEITQ